MRRVGTRPVDIGLRVVGDAGQQRRRMGYLIAQNGNYYRAFNNLGGFTPGTWYTLAQSGLLASNFALITGQTVDASSHPDFSASGSVMQFGLTNRIFVNDSIQGIVQEVDNWSVETTAVPEPSSLAVLGLLSMAFLRRRIR